MLVPTRTILAVLWLTVDSAGNPHLGDIQGRRIQKFLVEPSGKVVEAR